MQMQVQMQTQREQHTIFREDLIKMRDESDQNLLINFQHYEVTYKTE